MRNVSRLIALIFALNTPILSMANQAEVPIDECETLSFADVQEACDYFNNPLIDCLPAIDEEFLNYGYTNPNSSALDTANDLSDRSGSSVAEAETFMCRGGSGSGAGGGN